nr:sulfotransferase family 2 domain-containing protein [Octadecabacter dasysiphoniae]
MKLYFEKVHQENPTLDMPKIHRDTTVPTLSDLTVKDIRTLEDEQPFFGFSIVRDPMRRVVSAYTDKMRDPHFRRQINAALGREDLDQKVGFGKFLAALERQTSRQMNPHWRPQTDLLMLDALEYDHLCRLENLKADMDYLCEATDLPRLSMPHQNRIKKSDDLVPTPAQKTRIYNIYQTDFEAFGY